MLRPRDLILVALVLCLGAVVALLLGRSSAPPLREGPAPLVPTETVAEPAAAAAIDATAPTAPPVAESAALRTASDLAPTAGVIRGHITLSAAVVTKLDAVFVKIQEAVQNAGDTPTRPFVLTRKERISPELGTPRFSYEDIPFSRYGYFVSVYAEGVNGSRQFATVTEDEPVADVQLAITEGVTFVVLLRDQLRRPVPDTKVFLVPLGEPLGRPLLQMKSDPFGAATFDSVLQGEYEVRAGAMNASVSEPQRVQVQAHLGARSVTVEVPTGARFEVWVNTRGGGGIKDADVSLLAVNTRRLRRLEGKTDWGGRYTFENLIPGTYQLDVRAKDHDTRTRKVTIDPDQPPEPLMLELVRRR
ncbi:MAG: carboxypeptidase-like regulatory domain-containing protein [Planctomycetota bacterium]